MKFIHKHSNVGSNVFWCHFFKTPSSMPEKKPENSNAQLDSLSNPLDRYRIPVPRLVPRGYMR